MAAAYLEPVLDSKFADINERESAPFSVVRILLTENSAEAMRKGYSSDLTDSQWKQVRKLLNTAYHRQHDLRRDILDGLFYLVKTGCQWRMLPGAFAPWQTVYYYFRKWRKRGLIERLLNLARRKAREEADREVEPSAVMIDCQSVPTTRMGGPSGFDGHKQVKGRKRHVVVDTQGLTWAARVHAANEHESQHAFEIINAIDQTSGRLEVVFADRAYQGELEEELEKALDLRLEITSSESGEPGFSVEPKRWIVERTFGWFGGWRRLSKEYDRLIETSKAMVQLASLQVALNRLS
jgi:putative transposase